MRLVLDSEAELLSVEVVPVQLRREIPYLVPKVRAILLRTLLVIILHRAIEEVNAAVIVVALVDRVWYQVEEFGEAWETWEHVVGPVGGAVANDEALQVYNEAIRGVWPNFGELVVLVHLPGEVR